MIDSSLYHTRIETLRRPVSTISAIVLGAGLLFTRPVRFNLGVYEAMELAGFMMIFLAVLGRLWCILYIGGRKNRELCRVGPYAISRNPLYFFSFLGLSGICVAAGNPIMAVLASGAFLLFYHWVILREETRLAALFGAEFTGYQADVSRFWPSWPKPLVAHKLEVDGRAFTRALTEVFWFLFAIILVEAMEVVKGFSGWPLIDLPI